MFILIFLAALIGAGLIMAFTFKIATELDGFASVIVVLLGGAGAIYYFLWLFKVSQRFV